MIIIMFHEAHISRGAGRGAGPDKDNERPGSRNIHKLAHFIFPISCVPAIKVNCNTLLPTYTLL